MATGGAAFEKAMKLAVVTGLRCTLGPALLAASRARPERKNLALLALGEMAADKLPLMPSRDSLPLLLPRAVAGAWVAKQVVEEEEGQSADSWTPALGAAVAVGVATLAPVIRGTLRHVLGLPDALLGLAEDYLALKLGGEAVGMSLDQIGHIAGESIDSVKNALVPATQSEGAGSM
jgi:hypothetical protein